MKMEQTGCYKTSTYKIQTPGNYPEESITLRMNKIMDLKTNCPTSCFNQFC